MLFMAYYKSLNFNVRLILQATILILVIFYEKKLYNYDLLVNLLIFPEAYILFISDNGSININL